MPGAQFNSASLNRHLSQAYNANVGGYSSRGFVEVWPAGKAMIFQCLDTKVLLG